MRSHRTLAVALLCGALAAAEEHRWHALVEAEDIDGMREWAQAGVESIDIRGRGGRSPLMHAVLAGKPRAAKALLELGADPSVPEKDGFTPVHGAAYQGRWEIMHMLIDHGLDPRDVHSDGYEPIHRACWGSEPRHTATLQILLDSGVPYDAKAANGATPLEILSRDERHASYKLLKSYEDAAKAKDPSPGEL
ncbi:Homeobox protein Wariai [Diplonema papillatum]|nr:Homeobox protein Wariai [Diplonema papillatum]